MYSENVCSSVLLTITNTPHVLTWGQWRPQNICSKYFPPLPTSEQNYSSSVSYSPIQFKTLTCFSFSPHPTASSPFLRPVLPLPPCSCSLLLPHPLYYITHFLPFLQPLTLSPRPWAPYAFFCTDALCLQTLDRSQISHSWYIRIHIYKDQYPYLRLRTWKLQSGDLPQGQWWRCDILIKWHFGLFLVLYVAYLAYCVFLYVSL